MRCLVTGGSRNVGRAIVLALAERGHRVAFTYHERDDEAEKTKSMVDDALVFRGDVADAAHAAEVVRSVTEAWGGLDVLVNNATVTQIVPIALLEEADWERTMAVNVKGAYLFAREALKPMLRQKSGHILNVGSFAANRAVAGTPVHFAASKAALEGFSVALASEVGRYGIRVNLLAPGLVDVGLAERLPQHRIDAYRRQSPAGRLATAEEIGRTAAFLVSEDAALMTGASVVVDGGL